MSQKSLHMIYEEIILYQISLRGSSTSAAESAWMSDSQNRKGTEMSFQSIYKMIDTHPIVLDTGNDIYDEFCI